MKAKKGIILSGLSALILFGSAAAASAAPAISTGNIAVRSGPGTDYRAVDTLRRGERIDVEGCRRGWCYITHPGPDGWVSGRYLAQPRSPGRPAVDFFFNFGSPPNFGPDRGRLDRDDRGRNDGPRQPDRRDDGPGRNNNNNDRDNDRGPRDNGGNDQPRDRNNPGAQAPRDNNTDGRTPDGKRCVFPGDDRCQ